MRFLMALVLSAGTAYGTARPDQQLEGPWSHLDGVGSPTHLAWSNAPPTLGEFEAFRARDAKERRLWNACHTAYLALKTSFPHMDAQQNLIEKLWDMGRALRDTPAQDKDVVDAFYAQVRDFCGADDAVAGVLQEARTRVKDTKKYAYLRVFMGEKLGMKTDTWSVDLTCSPHIVGIDEAYLTYVGSYTFFGSAYPKRTAFTVYRRGGVPLHGKRLTKPFEEVLEACAQTMGAPKEAFGAEFSTFFSQQKKTLKLANNACVVQSFIRKQPFFFDFDLLEDARVSFWDGNGTWLHYIPQDAFEDILQSLVNKNLNNLHFDPRFAIRNGYVLSQQFDLKEEPITPEEKVSIREVTMAEGRMVDLGAAPLPDGPYTWAMNPDGVVRVVPLNTIHHSGLFQRDQIGLPLACAGELEVKSGLITRLDNETGHYLCTTVQLALAVKTLKERGMLSTDCGVDVRAFGGVPIRRSVDDMVRLTGFVRL